MNQITVKQFQSNLEAHSGSIIDSLPKHVDKEKYIRTIAGAAAHNPDIRDADFRSVMLASQKAALDGLLLDNREAALVVFKTKEGNRWVPKAQYQPMIQGVLKKLRNSGQLSNIVAVCVYENDPFEYNPAVDKAPQHQPDWFSADRGPLVGVYATAYLKDGSTQTEIMTKAQIEEIRKCSKSGTNKDTGAPQGIWAKWYEEKAKVAVVKRLAKWLPSSSDVEKMFEHDNEDFVPGEVDVTPEPQQPEQERKPGQTKVSQLITKEAEVVEAEVVESEEVI